MQNFNKLNFDQAKIHLIVLVFSLLAITEVFAGFSLPIQEQLQIEQAEVTENLKDAGKNGKHVNQKAKVSAALKYEMIREHYQKLKEKPNKSTVDKKSLKKLQRQLKHWKKKMDFNGENHSQRSKGFNTRP